MAARLIRDNRAMVSAMVRASLEATLRDASAVLEAQAKALVPVDTGALMASILAEPTGVLRWRVAANESYAGFLEWGTTRSPAQPYLMPAALFVHSLIPSILRRNLSGF